MVDRTNAERQRRYRAKRAEALRALRALRNAVTSQPIEKIESPLRVTPPLTTTLSKNHRRGYQELLSLEVGVCAREATLTVNLLGYARRWTSWDNQRIERQFELCRATALNRSGGPPPDFDAYWQAWCQRGAERDEKHLGSIEDRYHREALAINALRKAANGENNEMRFRDRGGMRGQIVQLLRGDTRK